MFSRYSTSGFIPLEIRRQCLLFRQRRNRFLTGFTPLEASRTPGDNLGAKKSSQSKELLTGFTLIELLVTVSLFSATILIGLTALLANAKASQKARTLASVIDNMSFAAEEIVHTVRFGNAYHCGAAMPIDTPSACDFSTSGDSYLALEKHGGDSTSASDQVVYRHAVVDGTGVIQKSTDGGASFAPLTAPEVDIKTVRFYVRGPLLLDQKVSRVSIFLEGQSADLRGAIASTLILQTTVEQRKPDN